MPVDADGTASENRGIGNHHSHPGFRRRNARHVLNDQCSRNSHAFESRLYRRTQHVDRCHFGWCWIRGISLSHHFPSITAIASAFPRKWNRNCQCLCRWLKFTFETAKIQKSWIIKNGIGKIRFHFLIYKIGDNSREKYCLNFRHRDCFSKYSGVNSVQCSKSSS